MPTYEYYCPANHQTLEVMHTMARKIATWGELCEAAEVPCGVTHPDEPVEKLLSAGMVVTGDKRPDPANCPALSAMPPGTCCGGGCAM